jgi:hypothetical protein
MTRGRGKDWTTNMAMRTITGMDITITTVITGTAILTIIHTITGMNDRRRGAQKKPDAGSARNMLVLHLAGTAKYV